MPNGARNEPSASGGGTTRGRFSGNGEKTCGSQVR